MSDQERPLTPCPLVPRPRGRGGWRLLAAALALVAACTDADVFDPSVGKRGALDRAVRVEGTFCTESASDVRHPVKLLMAMDTSISMAKTDPDGKRAKAMVELFNSLPESDEIEVAVMLFAGEPLWLTNGGTPGFVRLTSLTPEQREQLRATLMTFAYTNPADPDQDPNRDTTDFVGALEELFTAISSDIARTQIAAQTGTTPELARYATIFLSDGHPRFPEEQDPDIELLCESIRGLSSSTADVRLNTVFIFPPTLGTDPQQTVMIESDAQRLEDMSTWGGGEFRSFRNGEPINFLSFRLGALKRGYLVKEVQVFNLNARPDSPLLEPDSDADGLIDPRELDEGTDPTRRDTDYDGISDGMEVYLRERGGPFDPIFSEDGHTMDRGCPVELVGVDADHDGLLDCDEQQVGGGSNRYDTDNDGLPDALEWLGGGAIASADGEEDPDRDGLINAIELRMHLSPSTPIGALYADLAYRYQLRVLPTITADGRTCYEFGVDNVLLVPTLDTGSGAGVNQLVMAVAQIGGDEVDAAPRYLVSHFQARYPTQGIKDPPDGIVHLTPDDFSRP